MRYGPEKPDPDPFPAALLVYAIIILAALLLDTIGLAYLLIKNFK